MDIVVSGTADGEGGKLGLTLDSFVGADFLPDRDVRPPAHQVAEQQYETTFSVR